MAAASDKARFFLEQSVPELKEFERKRIFSPDEISSIARKRSDFEHKINARGSTPVDYARYAEFEINVDALRRKRVKRLGIKSTNHNGQRRIFFVFDRGTRKFPGDIGLWMQSIEFAKKHKAHKKLTQIFTNVLRLHPTKSEVWIFAAQFAMEEHGDMTEARNCMQRGLRFCKGTKRMWVEYARLEMSYMAKLQARRQILGTDEPRTTAPAGSSGVQNEDMLLLPPLTAEDINPERTENELDEKALHNLEKTPGLSGAISTAIFDAAMSHFDHDAVLGHQFFDMIAEYNQIGATYTILQHIDDHLFNTRRRHWAMSACHIRLPLLGVQHSSAEFPAAFREYLGRLKQAQAEKPTKDELLKTVRPSLESLLQDEEVDPALRTVAASVLKSIESITEGESGT